MVQATTARRRRTQVKRMITSSDLAADYADDAETAPPRHPRNPWLEQIFQRKLQDPRFQRQTDLAELQRAEIRVDDLSGIGRARWYARSETIQYVIAFRAKLNTLGFAHTECARHGHVELPSQRQLKRSPTHIPERAQSR